jgi:hypothetical protein
MRWKARITFYTAARGLRTWEGEIEADTAEEADERAIHAFRLSRPGLQVPEILDVRLRRIASILGPPLARR